MNVALSEADLPVRLRFERPMSDDELWRFCSTNDQLRVERDANGELILMSPPLPVVTRPRINASRKS